MKIFIHHIIVIAVVIVLLDQNNFIKNLLTAKSNDFKLLARSENEDQTAMNGGQ